MKNITLAVDEDVLTEVRKIAAERETTVNALVREYLVELARQRDRSAKARAELLRLSEESEARLGPDWKFNREDLYAERSIFPGHERADLRSDGKARRAAKARQGK